MDREFCMYLIELLDGIFPLTGNHCTLDFADPQSIGTYHINASLQLSVPLSVRARETPEERHIIEDVALVDLLDEEFAISQLLEWGEVWRDAIQHAHIKDVLALDPDTDFAHFTAQDHPLTRV